MGGRVGWPVATGCETPPPPGRSARGPWPGDRTAADWPAPRSDRDGGLPRRRIPPHPRRATGRRRSLSAESSFCSDNVPVRRAGSVSFPIGRYFQPDAIGRLTPPARRPSPLPRLRQQLLDHLRRLDAGQPLVEALVPDAEPLVVEAEQVQHRGVEVADVDRVLDDVVGEVVGLAVDRAALRCRRRPSTS